MLVVLKKDLPIQVLEKIKSLIYNYHETIRLLYLNDQPILWVTELDSNEIDLFSDYNEFIERIISEPISWPLATRAVRPQGSVINVGNQCISEEIFHVIAGPCAVESWEQLYNIAIQLKELGIIFFRAGVFKPRTSPYSFQGLGKEALMMLKELKQRFGFYIVSEVVSELNVELLSEYVDILQIGTRNAQNFELLKAVAKTQKPILLKRGMAMRIEEWLYAAEYILSQGNSKLILCERGIRTFETYTRFTLDLTAVAAVKRLTHCPVFVDPSHAAGTAELVEPLALAAIGAGADGLLIEVHHAPVAALSDKDQQIRPLDLKRLLSKSATILPHFGKRLGIVSTACC